MLRTERLLRGFIELVFILLGVIVVWLGLTGRIFFNRHKLPWLILSVVLILWGLRALYKPNQWWATWERWTRGLSLTLLGIVMFAISRVPFLWVGRLLALAGVLLVLRGLVGTVLVLRPR